MKTDFENINWELLSKNLTSEATDLEKQELEDWLALDNRNKKLYNKLQETGHDNNILKSIQNLDIEQAIKKVKRQKDNVRFINIRKLVQIAAILIVVIGMSFMFRYVFIKPALITVKTKDGERKEILLSDKSEVSINENSIFIFPRKFKGRTRNVKLEGEAYFIVTPNKTKPFIVELDDAFVKVLGTEFNIVNHHDAEEISVLVTKGRVQLAASNSDTGALVLEKGNAGNYNKVKQILRYENQVDFNKIAWKTKHLTVENETLENLACKLEQMYFIKLEVEDGLKTRKISATYNNQPVEIIMNILKYTLNVDIIKVSKNKYKIVSK